MAPSDSAHLVERILQTLAAAVPASLLPAFRLCLESSHQPLTVGQVAHACGIKRRALEYRFWKAGLRPPGTCLVRCRLRLVIGEIEQGTDSFERLATTYAFGTAGALRKSFARTLGGSPRSFRRRDAFEVALSALVQEIRRRPPASP